MPEKNYVIIGGSHGIGLGIVKRLIARQANVTVVSRTNDQLVELPEVTHVSADVTKDEIASDRLPDAIDGLAYCPGSINLGPVRGVKLSAMMDDYELNVIGAVKCLQAALPAMKAADTSSLVMFSTVAVAQGLPLHTSVAAAKGAVEALTRTLAAELAPKIRVNCVAPALTATRLADRFLSSDGETRRDGETIPAEPHRRGRRYRLDGGIPADRKRQLDHRSSDWRRRRHVNAPSLTRRVEVPI